MTIFLVLPPSLILFLRPIYLADSFDIAYSDTAFPLVIHGNPLRLRFVWRTLGTLLVSRASMRLGTTAGHASPFDTYAEPIVCIS